MNICVELIKYGDKKKIMGKNSCTKKKPEKWQTAIICPIHKTGDKQQCSNYRGISLINVRYKVLPDVLHEQLIP